MVYRAIGMMSGSSLDGLDIVFAELNENAGKWSYEIQASACYSYSPEWHNKLQNAINLNARDYQLLHAAYGHYLGEQVNFFIEENSLHYKVGMVASHGHTTFHMPAQKMTGQLGDGAAIAAVTGLPVISDLRALDVAFGGQGAPIVPIGEKLLFSQYLMFLNLGGIANISFNPGDNYIAYDVCPANRVLNLVALEGGKEFDEGGQVAANGKVDTKLLNSLNEMDYYRLPFPKSLANDFGTDEVYPLVRSSGLSQQDAMRTYVEHIVVQIRNAVMQRPSAEVKGQKIMVTGGGAFNSFLINRLQQEMNDLEIEVVVPEPEIVSNKEALIMALIGVLRWRNEYNVISSVTGARRSSIGGALWIGQEA
jgi:anhydro-N-acetylmuramic acid kinase